MFDVEVSAVTPAFVTVCSTKAQPLSINVNDVCLMTTEKL
jgi:hypothetical protein